VEALRAETAERLAAEEELLSRLQITRQTVIELLGDGGLSEADDSAQAASLSASQAAASLSSPAARSVTGLQVRRSRPVLMGMGGVAGGLPGRGRGAGGSRRLLRASQVCQAVGVGAEPKHREGMRSKLKRLVRRGWLVEVEPGLFAAASGVADGWKAEAASSNGEGRAHAQLTRLTVALSAGLPVAYRLRPDVMAVRT
jgi:hypothetical protein